MKNVVVVRRLQQGPLGSGVVDSRDRGGSLHNSVASA